MSGRGCDSARRRLTVRTFAVLALCAAWGAAGLAQAAPHRSGGDPAAAEYSADEVLVRFKPAASADDRAAALAGFHAAFRTRSERPEIRGWQRVKLAPGDDPASAVARFARHPWVQSAELNYRVHEDAYVTTYTAYAYPNDPYYQDGHSLWWFRKTGADLAMNSVYPFGGGPVIVAVLDSGVDLSHPEFSGRLTAGYNAVTPSAAPQDDKGHGTHVAGLIAAAANNGSGSAGIAYRDGIRIMPVKVLDYTGNGTWADVAEGMDWALAHGARVVNFSLGGSGYSTLLESLCDAAAAQGCVVVASTGNSHLDLAVSPQYPACFSSVIAVAATNVADEAASYSNYGAGIVAVAAPGGEFAADGGIWSTVLGGYQAYQGTSMAAPQVSGLAALLKLQNPDAPTAQIRGHLLACGENPLGVSSAAIGAGRISVPAALAIYRTPTVTPTYTVTPTFTPMALTASEFLAYPQPARGRLRLAYRVFGAAVIAGSVYNLAGERVLNFEERPYSDGGIAFTDVRTPDLSPGVYFLVCRVDDAAGRRQFKKKLAFRH